jgi:hypothetical protein
MADGRKGAGRDQTPEGQSCRVAPSSQEGQDSQATGTDALTSSCQGYHSDSSDGDIEGAKETATATIMLLFRCRFAETGMRLEREVTGS